MSARHGSSRGGAKLATKLGLVAAAAALLAMMVLLLLVIQTVGAGVGSEDQALISRGWMIGGILAVIGAIAVGFVVMLQGGQLAARIQDLGHAVAKLGRGTEVRVRYSGNDEIAKIGRGLQYLAQDLQEIAEQAESSGGGLGATMDPLMREMRDASLPGMLEQAEGYELDAALSAGTRGGLEYYDCVHSKGAQVLYLVANEGTGATAAIAVRMARDEIHRALEAGSTARKALAHTNRVLHKRLPGGVCAKATLIELLGDEAKLYQAGARSAALVCSAGDADELHAEGIALGLDEGPVFEKGLRSEKIALQQGVRVVLANEAAMRLDGFVDAVIEHSPKHTTPFLNMVLGEVEAEAGEGGLREDVILLTVKRW